MNRVSIVNLGGRAFHLDEDAAAAITAWLDAAAARLAHDPGRDELLADFERAIADKCEDFVDGERDVVTVDEVRGVLDGLGSVEPVEEHSPDAPAAPSSEPPPLRERKLYRLTDDDDVMIAGVCSGIAAYFNIDVTVVRVLTIILAVLSSGAVAIIYIAMALIVPEADTAERRAAVRGYGETAQEMLDRARSNAGPALEALGDVFAAIWRVFVAVVHAAAIIATWVLLASWAAAVTWVVIGGEELLSAFDAGTSSWLVGLWVTSVAWICISITLAIAGATGRRRTPEDEARRRRAPLHVARNATWLVSIVAAVVAAAAIPMLYSDDLMGLRDGEGRITLGGETFCLQDPDGEPTRTERCRAGDKVIVTQE